VGEGAVVDGEVVGVDGAVVDGEVVGVDGEVVGVVDDVEGNKQVQFLVDTSHFAKLQTQYFLVGSAQVPVFQAQPTIWSLVIAN
jgi:hypothetical protein